MTAPTRFHLSLPHGGRGPGVLVLHESRGLTDDIVWAAEKLASHGYVALAPDLTTVMGGTVGAVGQLLIGRGPLLEAAGRHVDYLLSRSEVDSGNVAVVGFSMGGALALMLDRHPRVSLIGCHYGMVTRGALRAREVQVVASFGDMDRLLPRGDAPLRRRLATSTLPHDIVVYSDTGHSFMTPVSPSSHARVDDWLGIVPNEASSILAWDRLVGQLNRHLPATIP